MRIEDWPRTTTRTTYYAMHHTLRHLAWVNQEAMQESLTNLQIYGRALVRVGADGILTVLGPDE